MKNTGKRFLTVMARINLVENGRANYRDYEAREWECIPNTFEEAEQLILELAAVMHKYGDEKDVSPSCTKGEDIK
jgi:hypothetical protein